MATKSYIIDETHYSIKLNEPFQDDLIKCDNSYQFNSILDLVLTESQRLDLFGSRIIFKISDKKIEKAFDFIKTTRP